MANRADSKESRRAGLGRQHEKSTPREPVQTACSSKEARGGIDLNLEVLSESTSSK